ncbi:MAG: rhomboid family intramembrane serine protease [Pseudomonadota bacterium]
MSTFDPSLPLHDVQFQVRKDRAPRRVVRVAALAGVLFVGVLVAIRRTVGWAEVVFACVEAGLLLWLFLHLRRKFPPGTVPLNIAADGIRSPYLSGERQHYAWSEIQGVETRTVGGQLLLELQLAGADGAGRGGLSAKSARPALNLVVFPPADHEAIVGAVLQRLAAQGPGDALPVANPFEAERLFQAHLKALAPRPWVTWALAALNIGVWLLMLRAGTDVWQIPVGRLFTWGANAASEVQRGAWWRLPASTFLHSGLVHIAMNMLVLFSFGPLAERLFGPRAFVLLYLASGLVGSALSLSFSAQKVVSVGASGALFGVAGALMTTVWRHRDRLPPLFGRRAKTAFATFVVYSLGQGFAHQGVDNAAHVGGLVAGCLLALLLPVRVGAEARGAGSRELSFAALACAALVVATALAAPAASLDQRAVIDSEARIVLLLDDFKNAIALLKPESAEIAAGGSREWAADTRGRTEHGPRLAGIAQRLRALILRPDDLRKAWLDDVRQFCELSAEVMELPSVPEPGTGKPVAADKARSDELEAKIKRMGVRMAADGEDMARQAEKLKKAR